MTRFQNPGVKNLRVPILCSLLALALAGCHDHPTTNAVVAIEFTQIPPAAQGGRERVDTISGRVTGARPGQQIVLSPLLCLQTDALVVDLGNRRRLILRSGGCNCKFGVVNAQCSSMRAALLTDSIQIVDDLELGVLGSTDVEVRIEAAGVCRSDLSVVQGTIRSPRPVVLGHEGAGVVERVGSAVTAVAPGDHVVLITLATCGRCPACAAGRWKRAVIAAP